VVTIDFYNKYYATIESSKAHAEFCELVYGMNLCQHGMADMSQINELIRRLNLSTSDRLLDIGCGNGCITEYIQKTTGAHVTGIDLSPVAIERARKRTHDRTEKLTFEKQDMNNLQFPFASFDAVALIDTHYFANEFERLLDELCAIVSRDGQIAIFSDQGTGIPGRDDSQLEPGESKIGQLLDRKHIRYETVNFTKQNREHWRHKAKVLQELKSAFQLEGNSFIYENRISECFSSDRDLDCRFLFHLFKNGPAT